MSEPSAVAALLDHALLLSRELLQLAQAGNAAQAVALDTQRRQLLRSARAGTAAFGARETALIAEIAALNDRALGLLQHVQRGKARELDVAMTGRRALAAYAATG